MTARSPICCHGTPMEPSHESGAVSSTPTEATMASRNLALSGRQWPASPIMELHQELDRLFNSMLGGWGMSAASAFGAMPQIEVCEQGSELCVSVELPGVRQEDLDVRLMGDTLVISGEKKSSNDQRQNNMHLSERSYGRFQRQVALPFTPDPERTQASLENGVLTVRLGRMPESAGSRRIEVRSSAQNGPQPLQMEGQGQFERQGPMASQGQMAGQGQTASQAQPTPQAASANAGGTTMPSAAGSTGSAGAPGSEEGGPP
ncbi:hypothetical protein CAL14_10840 [Bordetella genomosp. 9]|nr:hypothetical protein CAL14_10840 [Bordetella genomosp. 9]